MKVYRREASASQMWEILLCSKVNWHISIVQCYEQTEGANCPAKHEFYIIFLMGDFNAKIGNTNSRLERAIGIHGCHTATMERGLSSCVSQLQLIIGSFIVPHKEIHKYTWISPSEKIHNQIDHIFVSGSEEARYSMTGIDEEQTYIATMNLL